MSLGCDLTIGPRVKDTYIILHPGKPCRILEQRKLKVRLMNGDGQAVHQDLGGWIAMPPEHWEALKRTLEKASSDTD